MTRYRVLAALLLVLGGILGTAPAAHALPGIDDCKDAPVPEAPGRGMNGWLLPAPENPSTADPFAEDATVSIFEVYGTAGLRYSTYDLGCGPEAARDPAAAGGTALANYVMNGPKAFIAGTSAVASGVYDPDWLGAFDEPLTDVSAGLRDAVFTPLAPLALLGTAVLVLWAASRMRIGKAATTALFAVLAFTAAAGAATLPVTLGQAADSVIAGSTGAVNNRLAGNDGGASDVAAVAPLSDRILYEHWLAGTLGGANTETASTFGPDLYRASALSWAEAEVVESDPQGAGKAIIDAKAELWTETAAAVQENDPDAYEYLVGRRSADRVGEAATSTVACLLILPFLLMAFVLMIAAFIIIRFLVMMLPVLALLWILPSMHTLAKNTAMMGLSAIINSIVFGVGSTVTIVVVGLLLDPVTALPSWLGLLLSGVFCAIMWITLAPFRRLTALVTGVDPVADTRRSFDRVKDTTLGLLGRVASTAVGLKVGAAGLADDIGDSVRAAQDGGADAPTRPEGFSRPSTVDQQVLPEPVYDLQFASVVLTPVAGPMVEAPAPVGAITAGTPSTGPGPAQPVPGGGVDAASSDDAPTRSNAPAFALPAAPVQRPVPRSTALPADPYPPVWQGLPEAETSTGPPPVQRIDPVVDENGQEVFVIYTPEDGWSSTSATGTGTEQGDA